jgi:hypothetical protein
MTPRIVTGLLVVVLLVWAGATVVYADTSLNEVFSQLEQIYQLPQGILGKLANAESGGNRFAQNSATGALGLFQWIDRYWQPTAYAAYGQYVSPEDRTNPTVSAKVTAYSMSLTKSQLGSLIGQAKVDMSLGLYMGQFLGTGDLKKFLQAYIQDPNQSASRLLPLAAQYNSSIFNGRSLAEVLNVMANKIKVAGVAVNITGDFSDKNGISYAYSNADLGFGNYRATPYAVSGPTTQSYPSTYTSAQDQSLVTQSLTTAQSVSSIAATVGQAVAFILVQPQTVKRGDQILVAWTSVGMSSSTPCTVSQDSVQLAQSNSGSQVVQTSTLQPGTVTFGFTCTSASGSKIQKSATATVK